MATYNGTPSNDTLTGGNQSDVFNIGGNASATPTGLGNDSVVGGGGNGIDTASYSLNSTSQALNLVANSSNIYTGTDGVGGTDTLSGFETIIGGAGNDTINAALATAAINLQGGAGNNVLTGGTLADTISATSGNNVLNGGGGDDTVTGGGGNDTIDGGAGADSLLGGDSDDTITGGAGNDRLDGGAGQDAADYRTSTGNVVISYTNVTGAEYTATSDGLGGSDSMTGMDDFLGGSGNDTISTNGSSWVHRIEGNAGADSLVGGSGGDTLVGGSGNDTLDGNGGSDIADYSASTASVSLAYNSALSGGAGFTGADGTGATSGTDTVRNVETIFGGSAADTINATGSSTAMYLSGNAGNDVLVGGTGLDTLDGGADTDTASYTASTTSVSLVYNATLAGGAGFTGTDVLRNMETILGGSAADTIDASGSSAAIRIEGGAGADSLVGGTGNDTLIGGTGDDTLAGGGGTDTYTTAGNAADYAVTFGQDAGGSFALVTDTNTANGNDGADKVYGAETLRFADGATRNIAVTKPTLAFGDANGLVNASEASGTPITINGLAAGETAVVTLKSSAGTATVTASFNGNGTVNANVSGLGDGTVTITQVAVTSGGTTNTFTDPAPGATVALDKAAPAETTTIRLATDTGASSSDGITSNPTLSGTVSSGVAGVTVTVLDGTTALGTATTVAGGNWTFTPTGTAAADGTHTYTAAVTDGAGNRGTAAATSPAGTALDAAAPAVTGVAYGSNDGTLAAGEPVTLTVNFNENVFVAGGSPTLSLNSGGTATYVSGSGGQTLTFTYTPAAGQSATDLAITGLNLPAGVTVRDAAGNAVNAAGAVANPAGTLAVDTAAPSITAAAAPSGTFGIGQEVSFTLTGSEAMTVTGTPTLTLSNGATATYASGSGTGSLVFKYTVAAGQTDSGDVNVTGINGTIKDAAGNGVQAFSVATAGATAVDANAPAATTTVALAQDTGTPGDGTSAIPALTGVATGHQAGDTITIRDNGVVVGTAAIDANGAWTFANAGAAGGGHGYTAEVTDAAGNNGTATATSPASTSVNDGGDDDLSPLATPGADLVVGGDGSDTVVGLDGDDTLWGDDAAGDPAGDGGDTIDAGAGDDSVIGGGGGDTVDGGDGEDTLLGGAGGDTLAGGGGSDSLDGGDGADYLIGGGAADTVRGGAGDDTIQGDGADDAGDVVDGGDGRDEFSYYGAADVTIDLAAGTTSSGAALVSIEDAWGDTGNDLIRGDAEDNRLRGWSGDDTLEGGEGADTLEGEAGNDSVLGGDGDDVVVLGGGGNDTVDGGEGADTVVFAGEKADYTITSATDAGGQHFLVTDTVGGGGTAKVYGAEFLEFADQTDPVCFMAGTLVATPSGERAVETLAAGDLVLTAGGGAKPVRWLGRQTVSTRFGDPLRVLPVRIAAGALGEGLPRRDLLVSADHALLVDGALVQAGALVNGTTVRREARVPEVFTYWHVELADHSLVLAEGVAAETFVDNVARMAFDNWAEHGAAGSPAPLAEMALPRAKAVRQVPQATRRRLAARAALLLGKRATAA
ncbi:hypothetical protein GCM10009416_32660 [Craurococcus roseus]|uniref:Hedgehog/Intein (Hint) domain-containing protein n=1 Tax=Craurococcus roseus TaxID=77585 RepID=A0ABN1FIW0_9PROT